MVSGGWSKHQTLNREASAIVKPTTEPKPRALRPSRAGLDTANISFRIFLCPFTYLPPPDLGPLPGMIELDRDEVATSGRRLAEYALWGTESKRVCDAVFHL